MQSGRRNFVAVLAALLMLLVAPAAPVLAAEGTPLAIDEGQFVEINGVEQWVTIRGTDRDNPVILLLHGGPGFTLSFLAPIYSEWEKHFTIVQWDQPGSGATGLKNKDLPPGEMNIARYVRDGLTVTDWVRKRLDVDKVVLVGTSWGSLLGVEMVHRRPELFSYYVGTSQPVGTKGNLVGYQLGLKAARERGDQVAVDALTKVGQPPYKTFQDFFVRAQYTNPPGVPATPGETTASAEMIAVMMKPDPNARYNAPLPIPPGYDGGFMAAQNATWKETWAWEARPLGLTFKVPVLIVMGEVISTHPPRLPANISTRSRRRRRRSKSSPAPATA